MKHLFALLFLACSITVQAKEKEAFGNKELSARLMKNLLDDRNITMTDTITPAFK